MIKTDTSCKLFLNSKAPREIHTSYDKTMHCELWQYSYKEHQIQRTGGQSGKRGVQKWSFKTLAY
jgi:hypothetical protein